MTSYRCAACNAAFEIPSAHPEKRYLCPDCGAPLGAVAAAPVPVPPRPLISLGHYRLLEQIGRGGSGVVFRAEDARDGRIVALKCLQGMSLDEVARFCREARLASELRHENIARVLDVGEAQGTPYIALEYLEGVTLDRSDLPMRALLAALATVARAVHHAHTQGVLHRDLKPRNLLIDGAGKPWVLDFGLSKRVQADTPTPTLSMTGLILGTPAYMSPEQARGDVHDLDARTDVYGLGATLYHALTGLAPFPGETPLKVLMKVLSDEPLPVEKANRNVAPDLARVVRRAMAKTKAARHESALAFAEDLDRVLRGEPVEPAIEQEEFDELTETITRVSEAILDFPNDATLYATRARVHADRARLQRRRGGPWRNDLDWAIDDITDALEHGGDASCYLLRGRFHLSQRNLDAAVADLTRARELLPPADVRPRLALARALVAKARRQAKSGQEAASWFESARGELALVTHARAMRPRAVVALAYARHLASADADARPLFREALDALLTLPDRDAAGLRLRADIRAAWAECERDAGRPWRDLSQEALADYDAALRLVAHDPKAQRGRERLAAMA